VHFAVDGSAFFGTLLASAGVKSEKGKPSVSWGRKVTGLAVPGGKTAGLPDSPTDGT
jgi:hypothetical protein